MMRKPAFVKGSSSPSIRIGVKQMMADLREPIKRTRFRAEGFDLAEIR